MSQVWRCISPCIFLTPGILEFLIFKIKELGANLVSTYSRLYFLTERH